MTRSVAGRLRPLDFSPFESALSGLSSDRSLELEQLVESASVTELGGLLDAGRLTAAELVLHHLDRIRRLDAGLNSILELNPEVLAEAEASDRRRADGAGRGPLDGIPITLKDNIETAPPMHTTGGAVVLADHLAEQDAPIVASLRQAGAVILGKANLSELAGAISRVAGVSAVGGQTTNPYGAAFTPGGSSSGSAVAVAAGFCTVSVGTETSGSLLAPAAFNGVVAMKPGRGVLSGEGIIPLVSFQDSAGPVARSVADAAILFEAMGGPAAELPVASLHGAVAGVLAADIVAQRPGHEDPTDNPHLVELIRAGVGELRCAGRRRDHRPRGHGRVRGGLRADRHGRPGPRHDGVPGQGRCAGLHPGGTRRLHPRQPPRPHAQGATAARPRVALADRPGNL